jgi:hypothetical protein
MKNNSYDTRDVKKCCEYKLGICFRPGKEFNGWFEVNGKKAARITIPKGKKPIPLKTYKSMADQLKLSVTEFDNLLDCSLSGEDYKTHLRDLLGE